MSLKNAFTPPRPGDSVAFRKTMTVAEQSLFTGISGNLGGLYVDRVKAAEAGLPGMAVFELAAASLLTTCLARIAGPGYRIARFTASFDRALAVGATVEARATFTQMQGASLIFLLELSADSVAVSAGEAVLVPVGEAVDV